VREMFRNIFSAIATLFHAVERGANALDSYAKWAEDEARDFEQQASIERETRIAQLRAKQAVTLKEVA